MGESHIYPEFFKVFIPQSSSHRLLIPTAFIACIDKEVPDMVILRNRLGRLWQVEVVKTDKGMYFLNGWEKFVKDNSLEFGKFIVFRYNGDCIFNVKIFGRSECEEKDTMASASIDNIVSFIKKEDEQEELKHNENQKEKVIGEEDEDEDDDANNYNAYKEENVNDDDDDEEEEEEEDEEEPKAYCRGRRKKEGCKVTTDVNTKGQNEGSPTVKVENCNGVDVGKYVQPKNAYFVTRLLSRKRGKVHVPTNVLKDFNIQLRQEMILRDQYGRKWLGKVVVWKDGRSWIGGWNTFCKWNKVTKQDICICEFIGGRGNLIQVHIVRAGQAPDSHQKPVTRGDTANVTSVQLD